jgi:predicted RecA/RadA family phage recombinase
MKNAVQDGRVITVPAPAGGAASGSAIIAGNLFGVAAYAAAEGEPLEIVTQGVFRLPKAGPAVLTPGVRVSWDAVAKLINVPASGRVPIGVATEAAGNGTTTVTVRLDGVATAAAS